MTLDNAPFDAHLDRAQMEVMMAKTAKFGGSAPLTPIDVQTFSKNEDRERLSAVALKAFQAVAAHWDLSNGEAAALLGVSESTWDRIKRGTWEQALSQDQLTRASAAIGVYKGLHLLFADGMADESGRGHDRRRHSADARDAPLRRCCAGWNLTCSTD